eukprot:504966-Rhodomonas_salina.2
MIAPTTTTTRMPRPSEDGRVKGIPDADPPLASVTTGSEVKTAPPGRSIDHVSTGQRVAKA